MSQLVSTVVRFVAQERNVKEDSVTGVPRLMEIIGFLCEDKMADLSASYEMAVLALRMYDAELAVVKQVEKEKQAEIKKYWDTKLAEFPA
jgi:hypothetical protein